MISKSRQMRWSGATRCFWIMFVMLFLLHWPNVANGCPNCKEGLYENYLALAFGVSVLFMMAMPFGILGAWAIYFVRITKLEKRDLPPSLAEGK